MLKAQLSVGFVARTVVGFILIVGLAYIVLNLSDSMKKEEQEKTLTLTAKYVGREILNLVENLAVNQTVNKTVRLPVFREATAPPYAVSLESLDGYIYVKAQSTQWEMVARYPLYLNSSEVEINSKVSYPPKLCLTIKRNTKYHINITC